MSWGYDRIPSPAMRKARRLKRLRIEEVSSVPSGAGRGVKVVLRKRDDDERNEPMTDVAKAEAVQAYALDELKYAQKLYPNDPQCLAKWHASDLGKKVLNHVVKSAYEQMMLDTALGDPSVFKCDPKFRNDNSSGGQERTDNFGQENETTGEYVNADADPGMADDGTNYERDEDGVQTNPRSKGRIGPDLRRPKGKTGNRFAEAVKAEMAATGDRNWDRAATTVMKRGVA